MTSKDHAHVPPSEDLYAMPGFLLHKATTARWIPYTDKVLNAGGGASAGLPGQRKATHITKDMLALSPPSFVEKLKKRDLGNAASDPELQFLRNKNILILGCSHDRHALHRVCHATEIRFVDILEERHGMFLCGESDLDFQIQLWFTKGALPEPGSADPVINFEDRIRDFWIPQATELGLPTKPDMILWASGTWDILGLRMKYARDNPDWKEQPISWQELAWHRQRLRGMISFIREQWPDVPAMYRPPPYLFEIEPDRDYEYLEGVKIEDIDIINESIGKFNQSAEAVMRETGMPIFRWAEKFVGNDQYSDTVHLSEEGYAQWLYADMMLYYLHYYTASRVPEKSAESKVE